METGNFPCTSPKILVSPGGVPGGLCAKCSLCNHEPPPPAEPPGLLAKAASFGAAVVKHVVAGLPIVSDEKHAARLAVCSGCDQKFGNSCMLCGCNLSLKASWAEQTCPLDKWPKGGAGACTSGPSAG